ncbi:MAG: class I SAM-dependent rRNA methyltransferase [Dehalococcoidales bacterium]|nr:class I SAM-dependent rRNA methyltransferase [Dehalococcoidales bacterium]
MMTTAPPAVTLKPGRDKAVRNRHHWIFSGAIQSLPDFEDGAVLPVRSAEGEMLGYAYFNRRCSITGRMVSFGTEPPQDAIRRHIEEAVALRYRFFDTGQTDAFRLINAEGDAIPGLIADLYRDTVVLQVTTLGMERLKSLVLGILVEAVKPACIYEKSVLPSRREEGLRDAEGALYGKLEEPLQIRENGLAFLIRVTGAQKTGFYLDQREMRRLTRDLATGKRVLNAFGYTGAFSVYACTGGAHRVDTVEVSEEALKLARDNFKINNIPEGTGRFFGEDVFAFLRRAGPDEYDFIILDPPAFAKKKSDVMSACRGYKDINRLAIQKVATDGLVMTFSCSHFVDEALFRKVVFEAAAETGRKVRILQKYRQPFDHPINIYHPETEYLKGFLLHVV